MYGYKSELRRRRSRLHTREDNYSLYNILCAELGFKDAWIEFHNNGDYFDMNAWWSTGVSAWGNWDSVERFMYRAGGGVDLFVEDFRYVRATDSNGESVSDHASAECDFTFVKNEEFEEKGDNLKVVTTSPNTFFYRVKWFFKALTMIFSDIGNLPELLKEI